MSVLNDSRKKFTFDVDAASNHMTALASPIRQGVIRLLLGGEMTVGAIANELQIAQSALSQHLAKMRDAGLVGTRRDAQMIYYSSISWQGERLVQILDEIYSQPAPKSKTQIRG